MAEVFLEDRVVAAIAGHQLQHFAALAPRRPLQVGERVSQLVQGALMGKLVADASCERRPHLVLDLVVIPLNAAIHLPLVRCLRERLLLARAHHLLVCTLRECLTLLGLGEGVHRLGCLALLR